MTQEELAEKLRVSRQTISKWELDSVYPEMNKLIELCNLFSCTLDQLVREDIYINEQAYCDIRIEEVAAFRYIRYAVVSMEPEDDAVNHVSSWAKALGIDAPEIIGWDFPMVSQEQANVFNMHGYAAALILSEEVTANDDRMEVVYQEKQKYIVITIKDPFSAPFRVIPNAYKVLLTHIKVNGMSRTNDNKVISCFEKVYAMDGVNQMDVYIAIE